MKTTKPSLSPDVVQRGRHWIRRCQHQLVLLALSQWALLGVAAREVVRQQEPAWMSLWACTSLILALLSSWYVWRMHLVWQGVARLEHGDGLASTLHARIYRTCLMFERQVFMPVLAAAAGVGIGILSLWGTDVLMSSLARDALLLHGVAVVSAQSARRQLLKGFQWAVRDVHVANHPPRS